MSAGHSGNHDTAPPDEFAEFARAAFEHRECRTKAEELLGGYVTAADLFDPEIKNAACPHGVRYWLVPAVST